RLWRLHVNGRRRSFRGDWRAAGRVVEHQSGTGDAFDASIAGYVGAYLYVLAGASVNAEGWSSRPSPPRPAETHSGGEFPVTAMVGLRVGDVRLSAGWVPVLEPSDPSSWTILHRGSVDAFAVLRRKVELDANVTVMRGGLGLSGSGEVFPRRD